MARHVLQSPKLAGIPLSQQIKIAMFADEMLLFFAPPEKDIHSLKEILENLRSVAGLCINYSKSKILPLTVTKLRPWTLSSLFAIAKEKIKYLGLYIGKITGINYPPLIDKIIKRVRDMERSSPVPLR